MYSSYRNRVKKLIIQRKEKIKLPLTDLTEVDLLMAKL